MGPMSPEYMKYLLEHDTVHGRFSRAGNTIELSDNGLIINGLPISLSATRDPTEIPWKGAGVEYVCESTGAFTTTEGCMKHVQGGAKKVYFGPREGRRDAHHRRRRQPGGLPDIHERRLLRLMHYQWPRAIGQGNQREVRHQAGSHDNRACDHGFAAYRRWLHEGCGLARWPRRLSKHRSVVHWRRQGSHQGIPSHEGQAHRHGIPSAHGGCF